MKKNSLRTLFLLAGLVISLTAVAAALAADSTTDKAAETRLRVGTFDSRAVAVAFVASETFKREIQQWEKEKRKAKAEGDEATVKKIDARGIARQKLVHHQGFGTAPVDDILRHIKDQLPGIAKRAGVDVIVSKWAIAYHVSDSQFVDVTNLVIEPFKPSDRTKRIIRGLRGKPPVSRENIDKHGHTH